MSKSKKYRLGVCVLCKKKRKVKEYIHRDQSLSLCKKCFNHSSYLQNINPSSTIYFEEFFGCKK